MKPYTVVWIPQTLDRLAALWLAAAHPQELADSADKLDQVLSRQPLAFENRLASGSRVLSVGCLQVVYRVDELDRMVTVLDVRLDPPPIDSRHGAAT